MPRTRTQSPESANRLDRDAGSGEELPDNWRRMLSSGSDERGIRQPGNHAARTSGNLGFFLELESNGTGAARLDAAPVLLADSRRGHGHGPRVHPLDARRLRQVPLSTMEQRLASAVLGLPQSHRKGRSYARLGGPLGDNLLAEMLDTTPCFLGGIAGLKLARGASMPLEWRFELLPDGSQRPEPALRPGQRVIRAHGLWYLDPENAIIGPLEGPASEVEILDWPALEPAAAAELAKTLPSSPLAERMRPPTVFAPPRSHSQPPQPLLRLNALSRHARLSAGTPPLGFCRLAFDYGGELLPSRGGAATVRRVRHGRLVEIERRRAEELAAMERLEALGLRPAVDCEGLPWEIAELLPDDAWLFPGTGNSGALEVNTPARWLALRPRLEPEGFALDYAPSFPFEVIEAEPRWFSAARQIAGGRYFELSIGIELGGERVNLLPAVTRALAEGQISLERTDNEPDDAVWFAPVDDRKRVAVRLAELRAMLAPVAEYLERPRDTLRLPRAQAGRIEELAEALPGGAEIDAPGKLKSLATRLREASEQATGDAPEGFVGELRPYQHEGLRWLNALAEAGLGGVLADDMGLGKTVQLLAHVLACKQAGKLPHPVLVVAPTSVLPNWHAEVDRYAPQLRHVTVHGPQRSAALAELSSHDLVLTSYALLSRDAAALKRQPWSLLVLDEAQQVKNPRTLARRTAKALKAARCVCMSGTPLENHLGELWSQMDLAVPGLLGDERGFRRHYRIPIEKHGDEAAQARLNRRIAPFLLRRSKADVAKELPPKTEIARSVVFGLRQRRLYDELRERLAEELRDVIAERGIEHSGIIVLDALLKLRQVCCDPRLVKRECARGVHESAKLEMLMEMLPELMAERRHVLVFSQFTEMLGLIAAELDRKRLRYVTLTGETRDRAEPVRRFQEGEVSLFLLSLRAGGVGLNLTAADTVIHYDPWWNPATEAQASDRAHRIGQDKPVFVYRLLCADTVEERIELLKARKAELASAVLEGGGTSDRLRFSEEDLELLLADD